MVAPRMHVYPAPYRVLQREKSVTIFSGGEQVWRCTPEELGHAVDYARRPGPDNGPRPGWPFNREVTLRMAEAVERLDVVEEPAPKYTVYDNVSYPRSDDLGINLSIYDE